MFELRSFYETKSKINRDNHFKINKILKIKIERKILKSKIKRRLLKKEVLHVTVMHHDISNFF
jgi:hypothetical protein